MRIFKASSRSVSIALAAALVWTAPGSAAHAAAAQIAKPSLIPTFGLSAAVPLAGGANATPTLSASPEAFAPSLSLNPSQTPDSALPAVAASMEFPAASVAAEAPGGEEQAARLGSFFDGFSAAASRSEGTDFDAPRETHVDVTLTIADPGLSAKEFSTMIDHLQLIYGFQIQGELLRKPGMIVVSGRVPRTSVQGLTNVDGILDVSMSGDPGRGPSSPLRPSGLAAQAPAQASREPFVPATRVVAELEKLAKTDAEKAFTRAVELLTSSTELRREVKLSALRVLENHPIEKILPLYIGILQVGVGKASQTLKAAASDSLWYIQRSILQRLARQPEALKSSPDALKAVKDSFQDRNASVRLAAAEALTQAGITPGAEPSFSELRATPGRGTFFSRQTPASPSSQAKSRHSWILPFIMVSLLGMAVFSSLNARHPAPTKTEIVQVAPGAKTEEAKKAPAPDKKELKKSSEERTAEAAERTARAAEQVARSIMEQAEAQRASSGGSSILSGIFGIVINAVIFIGIFILIGKLISKRSGGSTGGMGGGYPATTQAKDAVEKPTQRFTDVEGIDESLIEVQEIIDFLRNPASFTRLGGKAPKGVLLEGPSGTGKTLIARALAGETDSTFFAMSGSDFVELYVGMGARRVRELFEKARGHRPAVVFIDEIDAVGRARGGGSASGGESEREQTINALLTAMDGFDNSGGIIIVAATNRADILDPALLRPGRFDRKIHVGKPHMGGREAILTLHARDKRLSADLDLRHVAKRTAGLAGADLENILNEAALLARRRGADAIGMADIDEAVDRGTIGAKRSLPMSDALKKRVAYHEAGHVLANLLNENPEVRQPVNKFTIVPHGSGALGFAEMGSEEGDKYLHTRAELEAMIDHAMGGLVAEKMIFGKSEEVPAEWSTGPSSDLRQATKIARAMVETLGMGRDTGLAVTAPEEQSVFSRAPFGDVVAEKTWREVNFILAQSQARVTERLKRNRHVLEALTQAVLEKETLLTEEISDVVAKAGPVEPQR